MASQQHERSALISNPLGQIVRDRAPLTFAAYMDLVLYHPEYGYYSQDQHAIGAAGDFFTSVSLGSDFGELLAVQLVDFWKKLGRPNPFDVVEMGAGDGDLAANIWDFLAQNEVDCADAIAYRIIERSAGKRQTQQRRLQNYPVRWCTWAQIAPDSLHGCCLSNELVDALPVHVVECHAGQWQEVFVTVQDGQIQEQLGALSSDAIATYLATYARSPADYPEGYRTEVHLAALAWLTTVAERLQTGYLLTIDYGHERDRYYHPQRHQGTLKAYYRHRHHDNPYINLGAQDLTAHVNFSALMAQGEILGLKTLGLTQQGLFLMALGLGDRLNALSSGQFAVPELLKRRDALHQLIDPAGLGKFRVLLQGKGAAAMHSPPCRGFQIPE